MDGYMNDSANKCGERDKETQKRTKMYRCREREREILKNREREILRDR